MPRNFRTEDEGSSVMTAAGEVIGTLIRAAGTYAEVRPVEGLSEGMRQRRGWTESTTEPFRLDRSKVSTFAEDGIYLTNEI
jgi:hypothetical protein